MKAVMYGGGNIGRGFIGALFSASGYEVTFVDVVDAVVDALNRDGKYPVRFVSDDGYKDVEVLQVKAIHGNCQDSVAEIISEADIMATAVGVNVLPFIVPNLVAGLQKRMQKKRGPLNIIICENLIDADKLLEKLLKEKMTEEEKQWFDKNVGLVEAAIGRMVPVQTEEMKDGNFLRVCVEKYGFLPVNKTAFKGVIPDVKGMVPFEPFDFYIHRKLYIHNMGHAICAYLGTYLEKKYIYEAISTAEIRIIVEGAMRESALGLAEKYESDLKTMLLHIEDLIGRFSNRALRDTCERVGRDTNRKLAPQDRLIGAIRLCQEQNIEPVYMYVGAAGAVYAYLQENQIEQGQKEAEDVLVKVCKLLPGENVTQRILEFYSLYQYGKNAKEILKQADKIKAESLGQVV